MPEQPTFSEDMAEARQAAAATWERQPSQTGECSWNLLSFLGSVKEKVKVTPAETEAVSTSEPMETSSEQVPAASEGNFIKYCICVLL